MLPGMDRLTNELQPLGPAGLGLTLLILASMLSGCASGAGRLRYDLAEKGCFLNEVPAFAPENECAAAVPWLAAVDGVGCVAYQRAGFGELEAGIAAGMPVVLRLRGGYVVARGRDRERRLWVLSDERLAERVVSDRWLARRWTGWAGVGRPAVVTKR